MNPSTSRANDIEVLTENSPDLLVIGGGIVGSGIARDAAMRGMKVGLIDRYDFGFGTSSRSSRLLHGGLRYLEQGRIGLVHEASVEKTIIHHIAPHLAAPLAFVFPTYSDNRNWKLWQLKIGVKIYDLLCGGRNLGVSTWLDQTETLTQISGLKSQNLKGAVRYYDAFTNDARLVLDTLRSAKKCGATLLNYAGFENAVYASGEWHCDLTDVAGDEKIGHKVRARAVVNATGPWSDGLPHSEVKLRLTKGIHLVVDHKALALPDAVVMTEGKRILFVIPWGNRTIVGTTDTDYDGPLSEVHANAEDIDYVLKITNRFFPEAKLTQQNVIASWAGLRPLIANANGNPSDISRSHEIKSPEPYWWDVAGGKLTTHRLMAEQTVDQIVEKLGDGFEKCRTATEPLLAPSETNGVSGIVPPEFGRKIVEHYCNHEWAQNLDDVMIRRSSWHYYFTDSAEPAEQVAEWMSALLGWTSDQKEEQLKRYRRMVSDGLREE